DRGALRPMMNTAMSATVPTRAATRIGLIFDFISSLPASQAVILRASESGFSGFLLSNAPSEVERHLEIHAAVRCRRGEKPSCQRVRLAKERRLEHANRLRQVHVVEDIAA